MLVLFFLPEKSCFSVNISAFRYTVHLHHLHTTSNVYNTQKELLCIILLLQVQFQQITSNCDIIIFTPWKFFV